MQPIQVPPPVLAEELKAVAEAILKALDIIRENAGQPHVRWLTMEEFAQEMGDKEPKAVAYYKNMVNPNLRARDTKDYFDPEDVRRFRNIARVRYCALPVKGVSYPRLIARVEE